MQMSGNPAERLLLQKKPVFGSYNIRPAERSTSNKAGEKTLPPFSHNLRTEAKKQKRGWFGDYLVTLL